MTEYIPTIGLEIHVELKTATKMFCDCKNDPDEKHPNINVCPICMGHPGTLPVANEEAIRKLIMVGMALNCKINPETFFERKNYFYPDLPKGYQISQYQKPLCSDGYLEIADSKKLGEKCEKRIRIERIHLEEDAGRLYHPSDDVTLADYNRVGLPLMELVTKPDLKTGDQVRAFTEELRLILRYLDASDADMEKGQMRIEVNISVRPEDTNTLGTKVEVKNINSISAAAKAVDHEFSRQVDLLEVGEQIVQETRGWDDAHQKTVSQRTKEGSADYRYFPEPDLPPLSLSQEFMDKVHAALPELPGQRRIRFASEYGLPASDVEMFVSNKPLGDFFEEVASEVLTFAGDADKAKPRSRTSDIVLDGTTEQSEISLRGKLLKLAANYTITEFQKHLAAINAKPNDTKITPETFADLIARIFRGEISSSAAQTILEEMFKTGLDPSDIIRDKDLGQVSDSAELESAVDKAIKDNPQAVTDYRSGKEASMKFLVGRIMAATKGKANPQVVADMLKQKLTS